MKCTSKGPQKQHNISYELNMDSVLEGGSPVVFVAAFVEENLLDRLAAAPRACCGPWPAGTPPVPPPLITISPILRRTLVRHFPKYTSTSLLNSQRLDDRISFSDFPDIWLASSTDLGMVNCVWDGGRIGAGGTS